jgi:hypothetical protein
MDVQINYLGVVVAAISSMIVGSIWYKPQVFGKPWAKLAKVNLKEMGANPVQAYGLTFIASLVTAYVLAHVSFLANRFFGNSFMMDAVTTAFWIWLGFTAARLLVHDLFENRPAKLTLLNAAHELITLLVMGAVLGWLKP